MLDNLTAYVSLLNAGLAILLCFLHSSPSAETMFGPQNLWDTR